jgi:hypothetical protein
MSWRERSSDRRDGLRFEIVGTWPGSMTASNVMAVKNIGVGGVLIEAPWPLPHDSVYHVRIESNSRAAPCEARVRHVRHVAEGGGVYLIGLEFLDVDAQTVEEIVTLDDVAAT